MVSFIVIEKRGDDAPKGHGTQTFKVAPRQGEYVGFDDEKGIGHIYEVVAVIHPMHGAHTAGDLIIRYVRPFTGFLKSL